MNLLKTVEYYKPNDNNLFIYRVETNVATGDMVGATMHLYPNSIWGQVEQEGKTSQEVINRLVAGGHVVRLQPTNKRGRKWLGPILEAWAVVRKQKAQSGIMFNLLKHGGCNE